VGGEVGAGVVGAAVAGAAVVGAGWAVVGAVVVLLDDDDLEDEPHPAAVRLITAIPAAIYTNHCRTLIPPTALFSPLQGKIGLQPTITRLRFLNRAVGPIFGELKVLGGEAGPEMPQGPQKPPGCAIAPGHRIFLRGRAISRSILAQPFVRHPGSGPLASPPYASSPPPTFPG
jgi:hypothetical protein